MNIIFEDNPNSPVSKLIMSALGSDAYFAAGCINVRNMLLSISDSVCLLDVVPDNLDTVEMYNELKIEFPNRVFPIPCIEFPTILMLCELGVKIQDELRSVIVNLISGNEVSYEDKSLEKYLKRMLNSNVKICVHNKVSRNKVCGYYYLSDCDCSEVYRKSCKVCNQEEKGNVLIKHITVNSSVNTINSLYENISKSLGFPDSIISY